jgi:hypothetical protein
MKYRAAISLALISLAASITPPTNPRLQSPKAIQLAGNNQPMMIISQAVIQNPAKVTVLGADFAPTEIKGLTAFCDVKTNLTDPYQRIASLSYPATGGTFAAPFTNTSSQIYYRFGYQFPPR